MNVKNIIRERRKKLAMTQVDLAKKAGIHQSCVSKIENGTTYPSLGLVSKVMESLGLELVIKSNKNEDK